MVFMHDSNKTRPCNNTFDCVEPGVAGDATMSTYFARLVCTPAIACKCTRQRGQHRITVHDAHDHQMCHCVDKNFLGVHKRADGSDSAYIGVLAAASFWRAFRVPLKPCQR